MWLGVKRTAGAAAANTVAALRDDPPGRLRLAIQFYRDRARRPRIDAYRRAEVAFMHWQLRRGVLASPNGDAPGSPWWRAVNERLLRDTCEAGALAHGVPGRPTSRSVAHWLRFLDRPSPSTWYRAHNASIVAGYLEHRDLALLELPAERFFMDLALLRVLFAHCLVTAPRLALGSLSPVSRMLGDPRLRMADLFLSLHRILPDRYPLDGLDVERVVEDENRLGRMLDYAVIVPRLEPLYVHAATDLQEPRLRALIRDGAPVYAWSHDQRHVWTSTDPPVLARVLTRITQLPNGTRAHSA